MSYEQNIQRLSQTSRFNTSQAQAFETENANNMSRWHTDRANKVIDGLSGFSKILQKERKKQIEKSKQKGAQLAVEDRAVDAHRLLELEQLIPTLKEEDRNYHELKAEYIKLQGINAYPEADRLAKLSHYQQYGYTQERLRNAMDSYGDSLNYRMQNGETPYELNGVTYTAKQIRANNIQSLPLKEALLEVESAKLRKEMGLDEFSPEILELVGVNKTINSAKSAYLGKVRKRYSIDASFQTQAQSAVAWKNSGKTGADIHHFLVTTGSTVDKNGELLGNEGAWSAFMKVAAKEGIATGDPSYADSIGNLPIPIELGRKVGAKPGTTFAQHWPKRFADLKSSIKKGYVEVTNQELKFQKAEGTKLEAEFIEEARKGDLTSVQVNEWKRKFGAAGLPIPGGLTNYETTSDMDERESKQQIEYLMASQDGFISHEQLDRYNPKAALEFREKATKMQEKALKAYDSEAKIKAHMDTAFTNMGIKANEKSPAYVEAMTNAKADYAEKYNRYVAMGYTPAEASHYALNATEMKDKEGKPIPDSMGVLSEIKQNGEGSKYVVTGQAIEKEIKPGHLRVARIASGKREMIDDPDIIFKGTIGGDYGHRQLTSVKNNLDKYGTKRGLRMDKGAMQYYKGLARGRDDNWMGLLDKQLKATGHEGLWPQERPVAVDLLSGENGDGEKLADPNNLVGLTKSANQAFKYPSVHSYLYAMNQLREGERYGRSPISIWDTPINQRRNPGDWESIPDMNTGEGRPGPVNTGHNSAPQRPDINQMLIQKPIKWTPQQKADMEAWKAQKPEMTAQQKRDWRNWAISTGQADKMEEYGSLKDYYNSPEYLAWESSQPDVPTRWGQLEEGQRPNPMHRGILA